jgi:hypothetical protein
VKTLFAGVGMAAVAGLLLGGAMKPNLRGDDRPEGPQMFAGWAGVRSTGPFDPGTSFTAYGDKIPDYVIGTDWQASLYAFRDDVAYEPAPPADYRTEIGSEDVPYVEPYQEPPRAEPLYPSLAGGATYASDRVAEASPPPAPRQRPAADLDDEAPPEATGDTSPAI